MCVRGSVWRSVGEGSAGVGMQNQGPSLAFDMPMCELLTLDHGMPLQAEAADAESARLIGGGSGGGR